MPGYKSLAAMVAALVAVSGHGFGSSRYRAARVLRFVHRHPRTHRRILGKLIRKQQEHEVLVNRHKASLRAQWDRAPLDKGGLRRKMKRAR